MGLLVRVLYRGSMPSSCWSDLSTSLLLGFEATVDQPGLSWGAGLDTNALSSKSVTVLYSTVVFRSTVQYLGRLKAGARQSSRSSADP